MNKQNIKALIVDDEFEARENLTGFLNELAPDIEIIASVNSTKAAESIIQTEKPDIVFLDIEMPEETGIEFLKRIDNNTFETVFVTAYNEYAIKAFKLNAIDYILKPINKDYLEKTLERLKVFLQARKNNSPTSTEIISKQDDNKDKTHLTLRYGSEIHYVNFKDLSHLSSDGSYTNFYTAQSEKAYLGSYNLKHYEDILPENFTRVHRGYIINEALVEHVEQKGGKHYIILPNKIEVPISRRRFKSFNEKMKK